MGRLYIFFLHENHKFTPNVGKYSIHGWYGMGKQEDIFGIRSPTSVGSYGSFSDSLLSWMIHRLVAEVYPERCSSKM